MKLYYNALKKYTNKIKLNENIFITQFHVI